MYVITSCCKVCIVMCDFRWFYLGFFFILLLRCHQFIQLYVLLPYYLCTPCSVELVKGQVTVRADWTLWILFTDALNLLFELCIRERTRYRAAKRYTPPPLIIFGRGHSLPCCPRSNAFETATRAYLRRTNGTKYENGADGRTDGHHLCPET